MFDSANPYFKQVQLLVLVLPFIARHNDFALKGGTAINLFLNNLPRLSVDIDLVYLPINSRDIALVDISQQLTAISNDIENAIKGIRIVKQQLNEGKLLIIANGVQVKIEVSGMLRGHILQPSIHDVCESIEETIGSASMLLLNEKEIYAGKVCAALDRQHPRDLFDVKNLLAQKELTCDWIDVFLVYLLSSSRPVSELLSPNRKNISDVFEKYFSGMTVELVTVLDLEEARERLISTIHSSLNENQKQFLINFKMGNANWESFAFPEAKQLPSIKWKQQHLNKMDKGKRKLAIDKLEKILME